MTLNASLNQEMLGRRFHDLETRSQEAELILASTDSHDDCHAVQCLLFLQEPQRGQKLIHLRDGLSIAFRRFGFVEKSVGLSFIQEKL